MSIENARAKLEAVEPRIEASLRHGPTREPFTYQDLLLEIVDILRELVEEDSHDTTDRQQGG